MNYIYQDKETMKPGINVLMVYSNDKKNQLSKDVISRIKHLSVPMGLHEGCSNIPRHNKIPTLERLQLGDNREVHDDVVNTDVYDNLIHKSSKVLPTEKKTRKSVRPLIKIKTVSSKKNIKKQKSKTKKTKKKSSKRITKKRK